MKAGEQRRWPAEFRPDGIRIRRMAQAAVPAADAIRAAVREALGKTPLRELSIVLVDDAAMRKLHRAHLGIDRPTDVLAFDLRDDPTSAAVEGEVVVSVETAARQAPRFRASPEVELLRYIVHGVLHLAGCDDADAAGRRRMRRAENRVLAALAALPRKSLSPRRRPVRRTPRAGS